MSIKFQIITPERVVFSDEIDQVTMNTQDGEITVLPNHIPLVTILKSGELVCKKSGQEYQMAVTGGFAEIRPDNSIIILADTAERAEEIDIAAAEAARDRAIKTMQEERKLDSAEYATLQATLDKELLRLKVGNKYRKIRPEIK
ncbi:MAG: F0F1 ATP synthase subunit epsilon [Candidatus Magasanikbacteria bacterium]|nr:F0F1 ATP synthase subunit epsilon [Candidatus Magasanikbacteria bacterium]